MNIKLQFVAANAGHQRYIKLKRAQKGHAVFMTSRGFSGYRISKVRNSICMYYPDSLLLYKFSIKSTFYPSKYSGPRFG